MPLEYDFYSQFSRPMAAAADAFQGGQRLGVERERVLAAVASQQKADELAQQRFGLEQNKFGIDKEKIQQEIAASKALTALNTQKLEEAQREERQFEEYQNYITDKSNDLIGQRLEDYATTHGFPALTAEVTEGIRHGSVLEAAQEATTKLPPRLIETSVIQVQDRQSREQIAALGNQRMLDVADLQYKRAMELEESRDKRVRDIAELQDKRKRDEMAQRAAGWTAKSEALMGKMKDLDKIAYQEAAKSIH